MGRSQKGRVADLKRDLNDHSAMLHDTLQLLNCAATTAVERVPWKVVKDAADQVVKKATIDPKIDEARDEMQSYSNALQGFLLLCHGSTVGAGLTLLSSIQLVSKHVLDTSLTLLEAAVNFSVRGTERTERQEALPRLVGCVWEACDNVKKAPPDNRTAVGRSLVQVARSIKDVLREMDEVEQTSKDVDRERGSEVKSNASDKEFATCQEPYEDNDEQVESSDEVLGFDAKFSDEELKVAMSTKEIVRTTLELVKQLLYIVGDTSTLPGGGADEIVVDTLERIVRQVIDIGIEIDDIGASIYPPQEINHMNERLEVLSLLVDSLHAEISSFLGSVPQNLVSAYESCCVAQNTLKMMLAPLRHKV
ncbi:hypothetical protein O6H91_13G021200 [Diphasiastrum complanatum]|uniref:Uncharacterized protein n=1 Tax=Diphasiastrum complanatum TaxID=34168 RepID=A0ACC2BSQ8_DIPCM|nr:hypothetical protein O6H91_13G021200 [Diphasiastrum complanatum]